MSLESNFLIKFGLHHFVSYSNTAGSNEFIVDGGEGPVMARHARHIIEEMYGAPAVVSVR